MVSCSNSLANCSGSNPPISSILAKWRGFASDSRLSEYFDSFLLAGSVSRVEGGQNLLIPTPTQVSHGQQNGRR